MEFAFLAPAVPNVNSKSQEISKQWWNCYSTEFAILAPAVPNVSRKRIKKGESSRGATCYSLTRPEKGLLLN